MHRGRHILATLLLTVGVIANAGAQTKLGSGIRKLFSRENRKVELTQLDYSRFPAFSMSEKNGMTIESIIFDPHPTIVPIEDKIEFTDFSDLPDEYNIWSHSSINPYNVSLVGMKDTVKIDVSSYCPPSVKHVTSNWGFRKWKFHYGIDLKVHRGDTVRCAFDGTVRITRRDRGYGYFVVVRHDNGLETLYAHLNKILVKSNQKLKAGEAVGMGGNTGRSTGYHLHLEFRYLGNPINPNDIVNFETHKVHKPVLVVNANTFAYKAEIDKIRYWTVKKGDTLGRIAYRTGVSVNKLCQLNGIKKTTVLRIGRKIRYT
jgi:murein DD-endopeptidase MepM/ murein hydrolase activator NlpD